MNYFDTFDWQTMLERNPKQKYSVAEYHKILCPKEEYPDFLQKYLQLPLLTRLKGIGLLCGTDWTPLYKNRFFYSRFDHSVGVALIVWHFTHDKAQTIAGLLHDVSTPVFSHVSDFRKGDALTQTATEEPNAALIKNDPQLAQCLAADNLTAAQVCDYHVYPIADNEIPQLSADRLEYMYPSGMALDGSWTHDEIERTYNDISVLTNENGQPELGFSNPQIALEYCRHFCMIAHILQLNENKLTLHLLGQIMNMAVQEQILSEDDFMQLSESEIIKKIEDEMAGSQQFTRLFKTFRTMNQIVHSQGQLASHFCVNLKVKQRYINPLVKTSAEKTAKRLSEISSEAATIINDFLTWEDTPYGCVKLA